MEFFNTIHPFNRYENKDEEDKLKLIDLEGIIIFTDKFGTLVNNQKNKITDFANRDYLSMGEEDKYFLGTLVNNTLSLSKLLNEVIE